VVVYHGPTAFVPLTFDPYTESRQLDIFRQIGDHPFRNVNAGEIVQRILRSRELYVERQRIKAMKSVGEEAQRALESANSVAPGVSDGGDARETAPAEATTSTSLGKEAINTSGTSGETAPAVPARNGDRFAGATETADTLASTHISEPSSGVTEADANEQA
jgi:hypothetical protein